MRFLSLRLAQFFLPAPIAVVLGLLAGCATTDYVRSAQHAFDRALRMEPPTAFFGPVLARACGEAVIPEPSALVRPYYLQMVSFVESVTPRGAESLRRAGLLGEAYVLEALAQWRLGRLEAARKASASARESRQEALDERERALFRALDGVLALEAALAARNAKAPWPAIFGLVGGPGGAWRALGDARAEVGRATALGGELLQARLAAFKVLKDAREQASSGSAAWPPADEEAWLRLRAEAQIELQELAAFATKDEAAHARLVRRWQLLCGLDAPVR
jgi:hypothetical protein